MNPKAKYLDFKDLETGKEWSHHIGDWILLYCNFHALPGYKHPMILKPGEMTKVRAEDGNVVEIRCEKREMSDQEIELMEELEKLYADMNSGKRFGN